MTLSRKWILLVLLFAYICIAPPRRVQAYIDPGTGNYILQILLAVLFGALFALKLFWVRIKGAWSSVRAFLAGNNNDSAGK